MFDISFAEMLVIGVVALIVLGPERLPRVARTVGHLFGRAQRYMNDVKNDIQREIELDELKRLKTSVEDTARSIEEAARTEMGQLQKDVTGADTNIESVATHPPPPTDSPAIGTCQPDAAGSHGSADRAPSTSPERTEPRRDTVGAEISAKN